MDWIYSFMENWGYLALFVTMVLENMNVPIPSEVVLGFAGFLVAKNVFTYTGAVLVGTLAGVVGSLLSYALGCRGGRPLLLRHGDKIFLSNRHLHMADQWFQRYGGIAVFTGRLLPGIRTFISLPAGMARYPLRPFLIYTVLGTLPWTMLLVWAGMALGENWGKILEYDSELLIFSLIVLAIAALFYRRRQKRNKGD